MAGKSSALPATYSPSMSYQKRKRPTAETDSDWARPDGRSLHQCRPAFLRTGAVTSASGSAYAEFGNAKVIVSVYGPRESKKAMMFSNKGRLNCQVSYTTFASPVRGQAPETKGLFDWGDLPVTIICASLALADAGILLHDLVASVSVSHLGKNVLIDPVSEEESYQDRSILITCMSSRNQVTQMTITGEWSTMDINEAMQLSLDACSKLRKIMRSCLKEVASVPQE